VAYFSDGTHHCALIPSSGLTCVSDERLKKDIKPIPDVLTKLEHLDGVSYQWKDGTTNSRAIGFIAQKLEKVFPELVNTGKDGYKTVNYANFVAVLTNGVKELYIKVKDLTSIVMGHETRITALENAQSRSPASVVVDPTDVKVLKDQVNHLESESAKKSQEIESLKALVCQDHPKADICKTH
jgi:hypothetical protein